MFSNLDPRMLDTKDDDNNFSSSNALFLMFSSGGRKGYQVIDDEYEDAPRTLCSSILPTMNSLRSDVFNEGTSESQRLVNNNRTYQGTIGGGGDEPTIPPNMNSSTATRENAHRWNHIGELDEFFTHIYDYQQEGGFSCIVAKKVGSLLSYGFLVIFATITTQCVDYDLLFNNRNTTLDGRALNGKRTIDDILVPNCPAHLNPLVVICLIAATVYYIVKIVRTVHYLLQMREIQDFYTSAMGITGEKLPSMTWYDVLKRLCDVQSKLQLSIHNDNLKPIDVYHRILRYRNYFVAMVNQRLLPPVYNIPFMGKVAYLPDLLKYNMRKCLFRGSKAPWDGPVLRDEYKDFNNINRATTDLEQQVFMVASINLALMPFLFLHQFLKCLGWIAEWLKKNPAEMGARRYSNYGRYRVRHFQELDHELVIRLNRSHRFANHYMNQFFTPLMKVIASQVRLVASIILIYLTVLSVWDLDTAAVEHLVTIMAGLGVIIAVCASLIPDDTMVYQPEALMTRVTSELQYLPSEWKGKAHHDEVRREFEEIFQAKWVFLLHEILSPILVPFLLYFWMRPKCRDIIHFFRDHTTTVSGTGDVCTFAILDVSVHGDPQWNGNISASRNQRPAFDGKTEMSALNFIRLVPDWKPPPATALFLNQFKAKLDNDAANLVRDVPAANRNRLLESVHSLLLNRPGPARHPSLRNDGTNRLITPLEEVEPLPAVPKPNSLIDSLKQSGIELDEDFGADMRVQTLYLRGMHDEIRQSMAPSNYGTSVAPHHMQSIFDVPEVTFNPEESMINTTAPSRIVMPTPSQRYDEREEDAESAAEADSDEDERPNTSFVV